MKKAILWILILAALAAATVYGLSQRETILSYIYSRQSEAAAASGRLEAAALALEKELELDPGDPDRRLLVAEAFMACGNYARAEYHLTHGLRMSPSDSRLYRGLSAALVEQNRLFEAAELLSGIQDPALKQQLDAERPAAPAPSLPSGSYEDLIRVSFDVPAGLTVYVSLDGEPPSTEEDAYRAALALTPGVTELRAVAVDGQGLASEYVQHSYTLEQVKLPVEFADRSVERLIRAHLGRDTGGIYSDELWGITELVSEDAAAYETLADLRHCAALETLTLTGTDAECDLTALEGLKNLKSLTLKTFHVDVLGLESIGTLKQLEALDLTDNRVASLAPLADMPNLTTLNLGQNSLIDLTPLSGLTALKTLRLTQNAIENVQPLGTLTALEVLNLKENRVSSLYGLQELKALRALDVSYNSLTGVENLGGLTALRQLWFGHNSVQDLQPLLPLRNLEVLHLEMNNVRGLEGLQQMTKLTDLNASDNQIASLSGIEPCVSLLTLNLNKNALTALAPLAGLPELKVLQVEHNNLTTLSALLECPQLERVDAFGNALTDPLDMFYSVQTVVNRG